MTTRQIAEVERMNRLGLNDHIIAEALNLPQNTVWYCRNNLGLPVNKGQRRPRYTVYDGKTGQYLFEGTSRECADWMGIQQKSFQVNHAAFCRGKYKKYEIYLVEDVWQKNEDEVGPDTTA